MRRHLDGNKKEASVVVLERNGGRHGYTVTYGLKGREKTMRRKKMEGKRSSPCARVKHTAKVVLCRVFLTEHTAKCHLCRVFYIGAQQNKSAKFLPRGKCWAGRNGAREKKGVDVALILCRVSIRGHTAMLRCCNGSVNCGR
jgi:hypothetical protein